MRDISLAIGVIAVLAVVAIIIAPAADTITVLSYATTAIGSLATGNALK